MCCSLPTKGVNLLLQIILIGVTFGYLRFTKDANKDVPKKYPGSGAILLAALIFAFIFHSTCFTLKLILVVADKSMPYGLKCKKDLLIGYGTMAAFGVAPQIAMFAVWHNPVVKYTCAITGNICIISVYICFILEHFRNYKYHETIETSNFKMKILLAHVLYILLSVSITLALGGWANALVTLKCTLAYVIFFCANNMELFVVWNFEITVKEPRGRHRPSIENYRYEAYDMTRRPRMARGRGSRIPSAPPEYFTTTVTQTAPADSEPSKNYHSNSTALECNVCMQDYCSHVIPRILIGCGHTVCQGCIDHILNDGTVVCPYCRKETTVPDGVSGKLPKNYAILEMLEEKDG